MLMDELLPRFKRFTEQHILSSQFDYVVPIEQKGMLIVHDAISSAKGAHPNIVYRRAFDFIGERDLRNKRVPLVDDTVYLGRTINNSADRLRDAGAGEVVKFAFMVVNTPETKSYQRLDDITVCTVLTEDQRGQILEELSDLCLRSRPTHPDHLIVDALLDSPLAPQRLMDRVSQRGFCVEYRRDPNHFAASLHDPDFAPRLPAYASDVGPNKVRFSMRPDGRAVRLVPIFFPRVSNLSNAVAEDSLARELLDYLRLGNQGEAASNLNSYEAFTLSLRIRLACSFLEQLVRRHHRVSTISIDSDQLSRYYGSNIAEGIVRVALRELRLGNGATEHRVRRDPYSWEGRDLHSVTEHLLTSLHDAYLERNRDRDDRYEWESAGLYIDELARRTGHPRPIVSLVIEHMNDYGYASPRYTGLKSQPSVAVVDRQYRSTEVGTARLFS